MYKYVYVCVYVCMYVCMYACMYVCMYVCLSVCKLVCMYVCMHACMHACMYVYMFVCIQQYRVTAILSKESYKTCELPKCVSNRLLYIKAISWCSFLLKLHVHYVYLAANREISTWFLTGWTTPELSRTSLLHVGVHHAYLTGNLEKNFNMFSDRLHYIKAIMGFSFLCT